MVRQLSSLKVTAEYEDGTMQENIRHIRGLHHNGKRPVYLTIYAEGNEQSFKMSDYHKEFIYKDAMAAIRAGSPIRGRIICKPYWFHKLVHTKDKG